MKHLIMALALVAFTVGCAHTLNKVDAIGKNAAEVPIAVYKDVKENVKAVLDYIERENNKGGQ